MSKVFKFLDYLLGIMMALIIFFVFLNVVLRSVFNYGLSWSEELARYLFVYITFLGGIGAMRSNEHLGMDTLVRRMPFHLKRISYIASQSLILILMILFGHGAFTMTIQSLGARAAATGLPLSIVFGVGIVTAIAVSIICIGNIVKAITQPEEIDKMVTMHESEEDEEVALAKENVEKLKRISNE